MSYPDLLNIPDEEAFAYHRGLQKLASSLGLQQVEFLRASTLTGANSKRVETLDEFSANIQQTRDELDAQTVDPGMDENVQATSKHFERSLPKTNDTEGFKAAMLRRGKV